MIRWLLRRPKPEHAPAVKEAKRVQDEQFREWDAAMREVERVQRIVRREPSPDRSHK